MDTLFHFVWVRFVLGEYRVVFGSSFGLKFFTSILGRSISLIFFTSILGSSIDLHFPSATAIQKSVKLELSSTYMDLVTWRLEEY